MPCFLLIWQSVGRESPDSTKTNCQIRRKPTTRLCLKTRSSARARDGPVVGKMGEAAASHPQTYLTGDPSMAPAAARSQLPEDPRRKPRGCFETEPGTECLNRSAKDNSGQPNHRFDRGVKQQCEQHKSGWSACQASADGGVFARWSCRQSSPQRFTRGTNRLI